MVVVVAVIVAVAGATDVEVVAVVVCARACAGREGCVGGSQTNIDEISRPVNVTSEDDSILKKLLPSQSELPSSTEPIVLWMVRSLPLMVSMDVKAMSPRMLTVSPADDESIAAERSAKVLTESAAGAGVGLQVQSASLRDARS